MGGFVIQYKLSGGRAPLIITCGDCSLVYKNFALDGDAEAVVYDLWIKHSGNRWRDSGEDAVLQRRLSVKIIDCFFNISAHQPNKIIDIGAGEGGYLDYLPCYDRYSLDINPASVDQNAQRGIQSVLFDICTDSIDTDKTFDLVTCFDVLEHLHNPDLAIRNIASLLAPGGVFIGETGDIDSLLPRYFGYSNWWYVNIPEHKIFWRISTLKTAFAKHGIELLAVDIVSHKMRPLITLRNMKNFVLSALKLPPNSRQFRKLFLKDHLFIVGRKIHDNRNC